MKKLPLLLFIVILFASQSFSQSKFSILGKAGGQLLQDLSNKKELKYIGKALETASDRTYEMEKIKLQNKKEITLIKRPDEKDIVVPSEGYRWADSESSNDYNVVKVTEEDRKNYASALDMLSKSVENLESDNLSMSISYASLSIDMEKTYLAYFTRSLGYTIQRDYEKALDDVEKALDFEIDEEMYITVYTQRASLLTNTGKYQECIDNCNTCLKLNLTNDQISNILRERGQANLFLEKYESAQSDCNLSLDLNPDNYETYNIKGKVQYVLKDFNGAVATYSTLINIYENKEKLGVEKALFSQTLIDRAQAYYFNGKYLPGLEDTNNAIKLVDNNSQAYLIRGAIKAKLGLSEDAKLDLIKAKELGQPITDQGIIDILNDKL